MIADDRGSKIADRRRSQRELFLYNRGQSQATVAYISVSGSVKITRALCWRENRRKQHGGRRGGNFTQANIFLLLVLKRPHRQL